MAEMLQFDLVSPERQLMSVGVREVEVPGAVGDMTVLPDHAPIVTTLRPGILRVHEGSGVAEFYVSGGFAELSDNKLSVLAEVAVPRAELTREILDAALSEAKALLEAAEDHESRAAAALRVNDAGTLIEHLGI
jgi:F-type H+-transporting ATPase subunit epsilon